jgi:hypothetical protein
MTGGVEDFSARYPVVWHVIEAEGAGCDTLYPAAMLRRLAAVAETSENRGDFERLVLPGGKTAVLRPQLMRDDRLGPTLAGDFSARPGLWRDFINRHVFFWVAGDRRDRFTNACIRLRARGTIGPGPNPIAIEIDTASLLAAHHERAYFSVINTGSTVRGGGRTRRDENTLRPVGCWRRQPVVELAIRGAVPLPPVRISESVACLAARDVGSEARRPSAMERVDPRDPGQCPIA